MRFLASGTVCAALFAFMSHFAALADDHPSKGQMADFKIYSDIKWIQVLRRCPKER